MPSHRSDAIISCARSWVGTRFAHQGRLKKTSNHAGGVDCLGLLMGVAKELDLCDRQGRAIQTLDRAQYARAPDTEELFRALLDSLYQKNHYLVGAGDIALFKIQGSPQHLGIISQMEHGEPGVIHAYAQARKVVEHALDEHWRKQLVAVFSLHQEG